MSHHDRSLKRHPVVLRIANMSPAQIAGFEAHRLRRGGSAGHVDRAKANRRLLGNENWAKETAALLNRMRQQNHLIEAQSLRRRGRAKQLDAVLERGPQDPWDPRAEGPMREIILTAHKDWFAAGADEPRIGGRNPREVAFEQVATTWLKDNFGGDVVHARADHDETTYHIHAVILPAKKMLKRRKGETTGPLPVPGEDLFTHQGELCKVQLVPSKHPLLRNYEKAQDSVGAAFAAIGLTRGARHWAAVKQALSEGRAPAPRPRHKPAHVWRDDEEERLARAAAAMARDRAALAERARQQNQRRAELEDRERATEEHRKTLERQARTARAREDLIEQRARQLREREKQADLKRKTSEAVIEVADRIAKGQFDVLDGPQPDPRASQTPADRVRHRTVQLFARAFDALKASARSAARAELSEAYDEIRKTDDEIVRIARLLPQAHRGALVTARRSLSARIIALGTLARRQFRNRARQTPRSGDRNDR